MKTGFDKLTLVQQIVTPLAVTILILFGLTKRSSLLIPGLALGVFAVLLWFVRRRYEGSLYDKAMQLAEQGQHRDSLALLMKAEEAWALNTAHSTPKNIAKDFRRLAAIVTAMQRQVQELGGELEAGELAKTIEVYIRVYSDKKSFVFGTHNLKAGAKSEIQQANGIFPVVRGRCRAAGQELYEISGSQATLIGRVQGTSGPFVPASPAPAPADEAKAAGRSEE